MISEHTQLVQYRLMKEIFLQREWGISVDTVSFYLQNPSYLEYHTLNIEKYQETSKSLPISSTMAMNFRRG